MRLMMRTWPLRDSLTEWPFSSQSMSVNSLKVDPAGKPLGASVGVVAGEHERRVVRIARGSAASSLNWVFCAIARMRPVVASMLTIAEPKLHAVDGVGAHSPHRCLGRALDAQVERRVDVQPAALERLRSRSSGVAPKAGSFLMMSLTYWQKYADPPAAAQPVVAALITG